MSDQSSQQSRPGFFAVHAVQLSPKRSTCCVTSTRALTRNKILEELHFPKGGVNPRRAPFEAVPRLPSSKRIKWPPFNYNQTVSSCACALLLTFFFLNSECILSVANTRNLSERMFACMSRCMFTRMSAGVDPREDATCVGGKLERLSKCNAHPIHRTPKYGV